jgi:hypothetical protein
MDAYMFERPLLSQPRSGFVGRSVVMKIRHYVLCATILASLSFGFVQDAQAAFVYWTAGGGRVGSSGTATDWNWANGGSDTGLFGSPVLVNGNTFVFFPSLFRAYSANGTPGLAYDRLEFDIIAHQDTSITGFSITEYGDYAVQGAGGQVEVTGTLFLTNLQNFQTKTSNLVSTPGSPITSGSGEWSATAGRDDLNWQHLKIVLNNNLLAISTDGGQSFIEKKVNGAAVSITVIPEPATLAILGLGGLLLRRRMA